MVIMDWEIVCLGVWAVFWSSGFAAFENLDDASIEPSQCSVGLATTRLDESALDVALPARYDARIRQNAQREALGNATSGSELADDQTRACLSARLPHGDWTAARFEGVSMLRK